MIFGLDVDFWGRKYSQNSSLPLLGVDLSKNKTIRSTNASSYDLGLGYQPKTVVQRRARRKEINQIQKKLKDLGD